MIATPPLTRRALFYIENAYGSVRVLSLFALLFVSDVVVLLFLL
jgi:hypothetical protein